MPLFNENFDGYAAGAALNAAVWTVSGGSWTAAATSVALTAPNACQSPAPAGAAYALYTGSTWTSISTVAALHFSAFPSALGGVLVHGSISGGLVAYAGCLQFGSDGSPVATIRRLGNTPTVLLAQSGNYPDGTLPQLGDWIYVRIGYSTTQAGLWMRWWKAGTTEPTSWPMMVNESLLAGPASPGLYTEGTNAPLFDNFEVDAFSSQPSPTPTITGFTPASGLVGASVVITGTNFATSPGDNVVFFNNVVAAVPTAVTATSLTVLVPPGATTGPIKVQTPAGSISSTTNFTVTPVTVSGTTPTITSFSPTSGPAGSTVYINGTNFDLNPNNDSVTFNGAPGSVLAPTATFLQVTVPAIATTGPITITTPNGSFTTALPFTVTAAVTAGGGFLLPADNYVGAEDEGPLSQVNLMPYLRAVLKDTANEIHQMGTDSPTWSDPELERYLELARGQYCRHRAKRATVIVNTVANQQVYTVAGALAIEDVMWAPAGYDLDQISALAAALSGGPGVLWGGGVPVVGRVYFDSPASIQVWSIIRSAWKNTFGGHWLKGDAPTDFWLSPTPTESGLLALVRYRVETHWSDIPWQHRTFILAAAEMYAVEGLAYQIVADSAQSGVKLGYGTRALIQMIQQKYGEMLNIREPGVMAGRS